MVRGRAQLLDDLKALADLERVRLLFDDLETRREVIDLLGRAERPRVCACSSARRADCSGCPVRQPSWLRTTMVREIVGVLGVIGPTRLNYARIVPMVDYTAKVVSKARPMRAA